MNTINMKELKTRVDHLGKDELVLDVRSPEEFQDGHVPGSRNVPHDQVASHAEELRKYKNVFVYCKMGGRASMATQALAQLGLKNLVCIASGGMGDWIAAGYPAER